MGARGVMLT